MQLNPIDLPIFPWEPLAVSGPDIGESENRICRCSIEIHHVGLTPSPQTGISTVTLTNAWPTLHARFSFGNRQSERSMTGGRVVSMQSTTR